MRTPKVPVASNSLAPDCKCSPSLTFSGHSREATGHVIFSVLRQSEKKWVKLKLGGEADYFFRHTSKCFLQIDAQVGFVCHNLLSSLVCQEFFWVLTPSLEVGMPKKIMVALENAHLLGSTFLLQTARCMSAWRRSSLTLFRVLPSNPSLGASLLILQCIWSWMHSLDMMLGESTVPRKHWMQRLPPS